MRTAEMRGILISFAAALVFVGVRGTAQETKSLSVEWINSRAAANVSSTPSFKWLDDDRCVIYDRRQPAAQRTLEVVTPEQSERRPLVDPEKALASLKGIIGDAAPQALPFPAAIDGAGTHGVYLFKGDIFLLDFAGSSFSRITSSPEEEKCVSLSPDGEKIAFVRSNNLYAYDLHTNRETALTSDGTDSLLNGTLSWVYWEEVFGRHDVGYWWSHDSKAIAYLQSNEAGVSIQHYVDVKPWTPRVLTQRYPKVGQKNPAVRAGIVELSTQKTTWIDLSNHPYEYLVRVQWLPDDRRVSVQTMNRMQTELDLFLADRGTGTAQKLLTETDSAWVNIIDDLAFLKNGKQFLWGSERDGYEHLYLYDIDGKLVRRITTGNWSLRASGGEVFWLNGGLAGVDEKKGEVYFTSLEKSSLERQFYKIRLDGTGMVRLSREDGTHSITMSPDSRYYADRFSTASTLPSLILRRADGKELNVISKSDQASLDTLHLRYPSFFTIKARDGFPMPAQIVKPERMEPGKKYPVIFYVYSGPSAPTVVDSWQRDIFWNNLLLQNGYIVVSCDNRSATGISKNLEKTIYERLSGRGELNDLVDAVHWVKQLPYVDSTRIGIWGWSGGGSCTLNGMTRSKEFKAGIDVAGVTDFRYYDTKFAEQYMKTEAVNKRGFEENALVGFAKDLHGKLLIVHGTYDDNVHIQNTWAFVDELIKDNTLFELMIYPMRQHGIVDRPARIHLYSTMLDFWKRNL
ncbi:MAG: S9 family peptidase [Bacteroidota bacterium]